MRAPLLLLPIAFTTLASMSALGQEAPRVIFCTGSCVAVDQNGVRTPAPKGTTLREGQRLETGAGAYAQLKLGQDAALGVGERAQVRFDQRSVRDRDLVMLDQGRIRMLSGEAIGKAAPRALELRTQDGTFALRGADVEVRRMPATTSAGSSLTVVKVNAGDARLLNPQGGIAISKDGVQGIAAGNVVTDKSISVADVALTRVGAPATAPTAVSTPVSSVPLQAGLVLPPVARLEPLPTFMPLVAPPTILPVMAPYVPLLTPVKDPKTGLPITLPNLVLNPPPVGSSPVATTPSIVLTPATNSPLTGPALPILRRCC
jgi:hypothetical protein